MAGDRLRWGRGIREQPGCGSRWSRKGSIGRLGGNRIRQRIRQNIKIMRLIKGHLIGGSMIPG